MKMNVTETVKQACGHWPRILPALGVKVIKNRHQPCPVCGGAFLADGRTRYCSPACAKKAHRRQQRDHMKKKRGRSVDN